MEILDYQLQHYLRQWIRQLPYAEREQLRGLALCNQHVSHLTGESVYLLADDEHHARYAGLMTCKNPFCCPICSATVMEKYRSYIASAIEMLAPTHFGYGVTLTIPHLKFMSWRETMDILYDTWRYFRLKSFKRGHGHAFHEYNQAVPSDNWVRVCEFTWGKKNGAHPHFHCIWWTPRGNESKVLEWEDKLNDFWLKHAKRVMIKYWQKHKLHQDILEAREGETYERLADRVFFNADQKDGRWRQGFQFSRDKDGNLLEANSSSYICGWGADKEVTGNIRKEASHREHYTPYQIMVMGQTNPEMRRVYIEYCLAVTRKPVHHRVNFSKNKLFARVKEFRAKQKQLESEGLQKKSSKNWAVVCWFDVEEWFNILDLEDQTGAPITSNLLYLASQDKEVLLEYMEGMGISYHTDYSYRAKYYMDLETAS